MYRPRRIAALTAAAAGLAALCFTAPAHAADLLCGTVNADYVGHTYILSNGVSVTFNTGGTTTYDSGNGGGGAGPTNGTYTAALANLTFTTDGSEGTETSTFRGCDGLTTPGVFTTSDGSVWVFTS